MNIFGIGIDIIEINRIENCLLYTSDAADEL